MLLPTAPSFGTMTRAQSECCQNDQTSAVWLPSWTRLHGRTAALVVFHGFIRRLCRLGGSMERSDTWAHWQEIAEMKDVHEALEVFSHDSTEVNAICLVEAVLHGVGYE